MTLPVVLLEAAKRDIAHEKSYYNAKRQGLGDAFLLEVQATITRISWWPEMYQKANGHPHLRRAVLHRFPFAVGYRIFSDFIEVVGVFPARGDPHRLFQRL